MAKVRDLLGIESEFDRVRLSDWLQRSWGLSPRVARHVARGVRRELAADRVVNASELISVAGRQLGLLANAYETRLFTTPSTTLTDLPIVEAGGTVASIIGWLIGQFTDRGFEEDEPGSLRKETGVFPFDSLAPSVEITDRRVVDCCQDGDIKELKIRVTVRVADSGGAGNSSGVTKIRVCVPGVVGGRIIADPSKTEVLTPSESDRSEDEPVEKTIELCVPCAFVPDREVPFFVLVEDDSNNARIRFGRVPVSSERKRSCCEGA